MREDFREQMTEGTRDELLAELRRLAAGECHYPRLAVEAEQGVSDLLTGSTSVQVGHTLYEVTES